MMTFALRAIASALTVVTLTTVSLPSAFANTEKASDKAPEKISWVAPRSAVLKVTLSPKFTATGERILNLDLIADGRVVQRLQAVSGKPDVQHFRTGLNSLSGSREPLPQGTYRIGGIDRAGGLPYAMGDTFIPVTPQFVTSRNGIGIHRDADRHIPGGSGTIGCLAVLNQKDIDTVAHFIRYYNARTLIVDYGIPQG